MGSGDKAGFTIIETMLFLGISGLLFIGIMVGTGTSINNQRYRDSVTSLQSTLQQQFYEVANVDNQRSDGLTCGGASSTVGQSDCVILGKYITSTDGTNLSIKTVVGYIGAGTTLSSNDVDAFKQYNIQISPAAGDSKPIEWDAGMVKAGTLNTPMMFSIMILRSPASGAIRTFIDPNVAVLDNHIADLLSASPSALLQSAKICLDDGLLLGRKMAVLVNANATGPDAVEVFGDNSGC